MEQTSNTWCAVVFTQFPSPDRTHVGIRAPVSLKGVLIRNSWFQIQLTITLRIARCAMGNLHLPQNGIHANKIQHVVGKDIFTYKITQNAPKILHDQDAYI